MDNDFENIILSRKEYHVLKQIARAGEIPISSCPDGIWQVLAQYDLVGMVGNPMADTRDGIVTVYSIPMLLVITDKARRYLIYRRRACVKGAFAFLGGVITAALMLAGIIIQWLDYRQ